jgi:hypothetical protein
LICASFLDLKAVQKLSRLRLTFHQKIDEKSRFFSMQAINNCPGRGGVVLVIVSANRTEDRGFESRRDVRFCGQVTLQCCSLLT